MAGAPRSSRRAHRSGPRWLFSFPLTSLHDHTRRLPKEVRHGTTKRRSTPSRSRPTHDAGRSRSSSAATIEHIDVTKNPGIVPLVEAMQHMAFSCRDLHRAADIYDRMLKRQGVRRDPDARRLADPRGAEEGLRRHDPQQHGRRDRLDRREHGRPGLLRSPRLQALHRRRGAQERPVRRRAARARDRPHLRHADRRGRAAHLRRDDRQKIFDELEPRPVQQPRVPPRVRRATSRRTAAPSATTSIIYEAYKRDVPIFCPGVQRLLGRLRPRRHPGQPRRRARSRPGTAARTSTSSRSSRSRTRRPACS